MGLCNTINKGFDICAAPPITSGIEDQLLLFNVGDFTFTYDAINPLIITNVAAVALAKMYRYNGTNNSFNAVSKMVASSVGPRYTEELDFNIAGLSSDIKATLRKMAYGKVQAIAINNYKNGDSAFELYGAINGLKLKVNERTANDEGLDGGFKLQLANPDKLREPMPPRSVFITSYDATLALLTPFIV